MKIGIALLLNILWVSLYGQHYFTTTITKEGYTVFTYSPDYISCYINKDSVAMLPKGWQSNYLNAIGLMEEAYSTQKDNWYDFAGGCIDSVRQINGQANALDVILREARKHRIVMINEDHSQPQDRMFSLLLAKQLREIGYGCFGAEGLEYLDSFQTKYKIPNPAGGPYLSECTYGNLIRACLNEGYHVFHYDVVSDTTYFSHIDTLKNGYTKKVYRTTSLGNAYQVYDSVGRPTADGRFEFGQRDSFMAFSIYREILAHPNDKFFIHVGFGHHQKDVTFMGSILRNLLKEDFLAIDQIAFLEPPAGLDSKVYDSLVQEYPVVYKLKSGNYLSFYPAAIDMCVVQPRVKYIHGKPDWMLWNKDRRIQPITRVTSQIKDYPAIVKIYLDNEYKIAGDHATPIDVVYFENEKDRQDKWFCVPDNTPLRAMISVRGKADKEIKINTLK